MRRPPDRSKSRDDTWERGEAYLKWYGWVWDEETDTWSVNGIGWRGRTSPTLRGDKGSWTLKRYRKVVLEFSGLLPGVATRVWEYDVAGMMRYINNIVAGGWDSWVIRIHSDHTLWWNCMINYLIQSGEIDDTARRMPAGTAILFDKDMTRIMRHRHTAFDATFLRIHVNISFRASHIDFRLKAGNSTEVLEKFVIYWAGLDRYMYAFEQLREWNEERILGVEPELWGGDGRRGADNFLQGYWEHRHKRLGG